MSLNPEINIVQHKLTGDAVATNMLPKDKLPKELSANVPVRVLGDGNCLSRIESVLAFGVKEHHLEMRCRIVLELVTHSELYIDLMHITKGMNKVQVGQKEIENLCKTYAMFSQYYTPGHKVTTSVIRNIFRAETMAVAKRNIFMGVWQLFSLSPVLHCKLFSIYPNLGPPLCHLIQPLVNDHENYMAGIMWTSNIYDMVGQNWIPDHFFPVIPICIYIYGKTSHGSRH